MAEQQQGSSYTGAPFPEAEFFDRVCTLTLPASGQIALGELVCRDLTQLSGYASWVGGTAPAGYTPQTDMGVPAISANAGQVYGVFIGPVAGGNGPGLAGASALVPVILDDGAGTNPAGASVLGIKNTTSASQTYLINCRYRGYVGVWAKVAFGGTKIDVGDNLIATPGTTNEAELGAFTGNRNLGKALATCIVSGTLISAVGATLIAVPGSGTTYAKLNVDLNCV